MGKSISHSVGSYGVNLTLDTLTVQFLLNCVPVGEAGPIEELVMDGIVGPKTIGAIIRFQQGHLGFADGRVDPENRGGMTIVELNKFDPTPDAPPISPQTPPTVPRFPQGGGKGRKRGKKVSLPGSFPFPNVPSFPPTFPPGGGKGRRKRG